MNTQALLHTLTAELGAGQVILREDLGTRRYTDWSGTGGLAPLAVLRPRDTGEVSRAMAICHAARMPVVVQGGLTGLAGGANVRGDAVVLSLERMQRIEEIDAVSGTVTVQAGAILQNVQEAAAGVGLMFPHDLGARGSCTIGGNLATNAGGNRVIKYGMMREQVLGLEAVLADGAVICDMHKMIKNNSGYSLQQLLVGSEGTLAVITRAVLRLRQRPAVVETAWCGLPDYAAVTRLLSYAQARLSAGVSAFEVMWPGYYDFVMRHIKTVRPPLPTRHAVYVLMESAGSDAQRHGAEFQSMLEAMLEEGVVENAAIAQSQGDAQAFWAVRDAPAEFPLLMPDMCAFDISFAIADIGQVVAECEQLLSTRWPGSTILIYGHLGDGNLHVLADVPGIDAPTAQAVDALVYELTRKWHGSVSAEHGIGDKKTAYLGHTRDPGALAAMHRIKAGLDPLNLMNPGKLFPDAASRP